MRAASTARPSARSVGSEMAFGRDSAYDHALVAGDGATLVYHDFCDGIDCETIDNEIRRVVGSRSLFVAGVNGRLTGLAVSGTQLATAEKGMVLTRTATDGKLVRRVELGGQIRAVAVARRLVAALVRRGGENGVSVYETTSGRLVRRVAVPRAAAAELSMAGSRVVYRVGRTIRVVEARDGRTATVATAKATPVGLSIEARRIAWAENIRGRGRVRAFVLPRRR